MLCSYNVYNTVFTHDQQWVALSVNEAEVVDGGYECGEEGDDGIDKLTAFSRSPFLSMIVSAREEEKLLLDAFPCKAAEGAYAGRGSAFLRY